MTPVERARLFAAIESAHPPLTARLVAAVLSTGYASWCTLEGGDAAAVLPDDTAVARPARGMQLDEPAPLAALGAPDLTSAIVVRFGVRAGLDAVLVVARRSDQPAYDRADVELAEEIATRLAAALERAALLAMARREHDRAERVGALREEFLATLSHELRTPLSSILGWTQLLLAGDLPPEQQRRALETIERNTLIQAARIEDMLDVSGIITGKLRLEVVAVNLAAVVAAAVDAAQPTDVGVTIDVEVATELETVHGDPARIQQLIVNLMTNAIKMTPRGGVVGVRVRRDEAAVEIAVEVRGATSPRTHASLGLAFARQLVELLHGSFDVASDGRVTVRLPASALRALPVPAARAAPAAGIAGVAVLLVDDDVDTLELMRSVFELAGARVTTARSASEAFAAFVARRPAVLVSDIGMPGATGHELIRRVRALPADRGGATPAIALTAYARAEDAAEARRSGFDRHVAKPTPTHALLALVGELVASTAR